MPSRLHWEGERFHLADDRTLKILRRNLGTILGEATCVVRLRDGLVLDAATNDPDIQGIRRFFDQLGNEPRITATALQTVGSKGWDGFAIAIVN